MNFSIQKNVKHIYLLKHCKDVIHRRSLYSIACAIDYKKHMYASQSAMENLIPML